jgi:steroid 5-alpha reductase family enzyme
MVFLGVTVLEKRLKETKLGWDEYVANTSAFFPSFPRHQRKFNK